MKKSKGNKKKRQTCIAYKNVEKELHNVLRYDIKLKNSYKGKMDFLQLKRRKKIQNFYLYIIM